MTMAQKRMYSAITQPDPNAANSTAAISGPGPPKIIEEKLVTDRGAGIAQTRGEAFRDQRRLSVSVAYTQSKQANY